MTPEGARHICAKAEAETRARDKVESLAVQPPADVGQVEADSMYVAAVLDWNRAKRELDAAIATDGAV